MIRCASAEGTMGELAVMLDAQGYVLLEGLFGANETAGLAREFALVAAAGGAGVRNLLADSREIESFARSSAVLEIVGQALDSTPFPVRAILFDKTSQANWKVPYHQDRSIAVRGRVAVPGFGPWSVKQGVIHVEPPAEVLERMAALRVHLDPCSESSGPLRVIPGSHRNGFLSGHEIDELVRRGPSQICTARRGDVLLMKPLLLHASSKASTPTRRRVLHLEFAVEPLASPLEWAA